MPRPKAPDPNPPPEIPHWWPELLDEALRRHGGNKSSLARAIGVRVQSIMNWFGELREVPSEPGLRYLMPILSQVDRVEWVAKIFGVAAHHGQPLHVVGQVAAGRFSEAGTTPRTVDMSTVLFSESRADRVTAGTIYGLEIIGDSMEPVYSQGDVIAVRKPRPGATLIGFDCVVVSEDHEATFKRIVRATDGTLLAMPLNSIYDPMPIRSERQIQWVAVGHVRVPGRVPKPILPPGLVKGMQNLPAKPKK